MTEAEAKTKWCPFARAAFFVRGDLGEDHAPVQLIATGSNRIVIDDSRLRQSMAAAIEATGGTRCIGSACMAWRPDMRLNRESYGRCGLVPEPVPHEAH